MINHLKGNKYSYGASNNDYNVQIIHSHFFMKSFGLKRTSRIKTFVFKYKCDAQNKDFQLFILSSE